MPLELHDDRNDQTVQMLEEIEALARSYWEAEGRPDGRHLDHWLRAEREISLRNAQSDGEP